VQRITIPNTDLSVSPICLGGGEFGNPVPDDRLDRLMAAYLELGGNFVDTAHCYNFWVDGGDGASERTIGRILRDLGRLDDVVVATKGGHPDMGEKYRRPDRFLSPEAIASDVSDSLGRLGVDRIDLYYLHRDDARVPVGEIVDALNEQNARVRFFGVSNWSTARIDEANAYANANGRKPIVASQNQWSLATPTWKVTADPTQRYVTDADVAWHAKTGMAAIPYSSTANGFFSGRDKKAFDTPDNVARRERANEMAWDLGVTPTQVALAYLRAHPFPVIPIVGTKSV
jgi:aryl-alcohol dehydrogenase-like predicted oxidoreductase